MLLTNNDVKLKYGYPRELKHDGNRTNILYAPKRKLKDDEALNFLGTVFAKRGKEAEDMYDVIFPPAPPQGLESTRGRWTFTKAGSALKLDGTLGAVMSTLTRLSISEKPLRPPISPESPFK